MDSNFEIPEAHSCLTHSFLLLFLWLALDIPFILQTINTKPSAARNIDYVICADTRSV